MTPPRRILPQRRYGETFEMYHEGQNTPFAITFGFFADKTIGEVFINGAKTGSAMEGVTHDGAVLLSLAIQHGVPLDTISRAISRNADGKAMTIIGAVVDSMTKRTANG